MDPTNRIKHLFPIETPAPIETVPFSSLEEKQAILAHYIRLVARKLSNGVACVGVGGLGKSWVIAKTLAEEGISPVLLNSHVTPLSLYRALYFNRNDAIIWMDDIDSCLSNLIVLGILRSCLWGQGQRIVTYTSSQLPDDLPPRFVFDSRLIICANVIPRRNEALKATLTRIDTYTLDATNEEVLEQMRLWANPGQPHLKSFLSGCLRDANRSIQHVFVSVEPIPAKCPV